MDSGSEKHPVRDSAEENMRPGFLGGEGGGEPVAEDKIHRSRDVAEELNENEDDASKAPNAIGSNRASLAAGLRRSETGGGFYSGTGRSTADGKIGKFGKKGKLGKLKKASAGLGIILLLLVVPFVIIGNPIFKVGNLDYNLMQSLGFTGTVDVLEEQTEYITGEQLANGEVPANYAADLAKAGIQVGQVTMAGEFVPTNKYIANIDELDDIATIGSGFQTNGSEGELAVLFDNEVISAADFVEAVDSNPKMYMALVEGADISAKYYYSKEVEDVYKNLGLKRWSFNAWEPTGDAEQDQKNYDEILKSVLDGDGKSALDGGYDCNDEGACSGVNLTGDAADIINDFGGNKNKSGAELLNSAMSSVERNKAMKAFLAVEESAQQARIGDGGPVNEMMKTLYDDSVIVTYMNVNTGEMVEDGRSIIETPNFAAAASSGTFSKSDAANFSLDRGLKVTGVDDSSVIKKAQVSSKDSNAIKVGVGLFAGSADIDNAESSIQIALSDSNSNLYTSVVGGERIPEGGGDLNDIINQHVLLSLPSNEETVLTYNDEVERVMAKKAKAERATKSPFDISSPNTFMGSIVHNMANIMTRSHTSELPFVSTVGAMASYAGSVVNGLFNGAIADGKDKNFLTTFGDYCQTVPSAGSAAAGLYCGQTNTIYTGLMNKGKEYWKEHKPDNYEEYVQNIGDRWSMVGVKDAEVCKKDNNALENLVSDLFGVCSLTEDDVATGSKYVMSDDNKKAQKVSAYTLYDTVSSLLSEKQSEASMILEKYYKEHPIDNSYTGTIARLSGMTKTQTEIAFAYADYLNEIASYDASDRYVFDGVLFEMPEKGVLVEHSEKINGDLYCFWRGRNEYGDVRNRNFA